MNFRKTRIVANYEDKSELHHLTGEDRYVWMRPKYDRANRMRMIEQSIHAVGDKDALQEVRRISQEEFENRMFKGKINNRRAA